MLKRSPRLSSGSHSKVSGSLTRSLIHTLLESLLSTRNMTAILRSIRRDQVNNRSPGDRARGLVPTSGNHRIDVFTEGLTLWTSFLAAQGLRQMNQPQGALLVGIGRQGTGERAGHMRTLTKTVPTDEPQCPGTIRNPRRARGSRG